YVRTIDYLAVLNFIRKNHPVCWGGAPMDKQYSQDSVTAVRSGYDPNHLPSLDSLGLGFLLHQNGAPTKTNLSSIYVASFASSPNPFTKETTLDFTLNRMSYTQLSIYDELGRLVWGDGRGSSLEAGKHTVQIDASKWPTGTYYARISTGFGEVKTVKLVK